MIQKPIANYAAQETLFREMVTSDTKPHINITKIAKMVAEIVQTELKDNFNMTTIEQATKNILHDIGQKAVEQTFALCLFS